MAERPPIKTVGLTRDELFAIFGTHARVKAFEDLIDDVSQVLPDVAFANEEAIENAQATADLAFADAAAAQADATQALSDAAAAQADADAAQTDATQALTNAAAAQADADAAQADIDAHEVDPTDAHVATAIGYVPSGDLTATTVQGAIDQLADTAGGGVAGYAQFQFNVGTTAPPGDRQIRFNNAAQNSTTQIFVDNDSSDGIDLHNVLLRRQVGDLLYVQDKGSSANWKLFRITSAPIDNTTYVAFPVAFDSGGSNIPGGACLINSLPPASGISDGDKGDFTVTGGVATITEIQTKAVVLNTAGTLLVTDAGGSVTQATNKSTAVTLNQLTGDITMNAAALAGDTTVSFTLTNSTIGANDLLALSHVSGGTLASYNMTAAPAAGSAVIHVRNVTTGSLSEAVVLRFMVLKRG